MHPYERWTLRRYLANALKSSRFARPPRADCDIVACIESHSRLLGLPELAPRSHASNRWATSEAPTHSARWKAWRAAAIGMAREPAPKPSPLQKRLDWLARACSLNRAQGWGLGLFPTDFFRLSLLRGCLQGWLSSPDAEIVNDSTSPIAQDDILIMTVVT
jgi:hypothetical protein